jgi:nucleotide-binding universal stress UspA family protein
MKLLHLKVVLAAIDTDETSLQTLHAARELASTAGASLHVVHATAAVGPAEGSARAAGTEHANALRRTFERAGLTSNVPLDVVVGEPAHVIRSVADRIRADVIVLGKHRDRQPPGQGIGSTALAVVTNSWVPCLVLSRPMRLPLARVLVPVDLSTPSRGALVVALSWGSALRGPQTKSPTGEGLRLTALRIEGAAGTASREALEKEVDQLRREAGTWAGVQVDGEVVVGRDVPHAIAAYANEHQSDLVVLGTRGLGSGAVGRVGSVALGVGRKLDVPVLLVPPAVWEHYSATALATRETDH